MPEPAMLQLPEVTLVCVDTRDPMLALPVLQRCMRLARFAEVLLFTDAARLTSVPAGIRIIDVQIDSVPAYSQFMLRGLLPHVQSSHLLVVQWDGFIVDADAWDPAFLQYDYIGALIRDAAPGRAVGNGGFSLRSRRLLQALLDPEITPTHPEDLCICDQHRSRLEDVHGIRFAPPELAARFAFERIEPSGPTFGFHGLFNFDRVLPADELRQQVMALPDHLARGLDAHDLCRRLIAQGSPASLDLAAELIAKRRRLGMHDRRTWRLRLQLLWRRGLKRGLATR